MCAYVCVCVCIGGYVIAHIDLHATITCYSGQLPTTESTCPLDIVSRCDSVVWQTFALLHPHERGAVLRRNAHEAANAEGDSSEPNQTSMWVYVYMCVVNPKI